MRGCRLNLKQRMIGIEANLDDLQSGIEASARAADSLQADAARSRKLTRSQTESSTLVKVERHATELQTCAVDQRAALRELRAGIHQLRDEIARSEIVRPPPSVAHDRHRRR